MHVVSHEGSGAAPYYTRDREHQEDEGLDCRAEKHEVLGTTADLTNTLGKNPAPHRQSWPKQVLTITSRTDIGALYNFARTNSTREPDRLRELNGQADTSPSSVKTETHKSTCLTTEEKKITEEMFSEADKNRNNYALEEISQDYAKNRVRLCVK